MPKPTLTRSRILGIGLAAASLALASCSHSNSTPPVPPATPTPTPTQSGSFPTSACANPNVAYEPDGGNGNGFHGVQTIQYANSNGNLCTSNITSLPRSVRFASSVGSLAFTSDLTGALALLQNPAGSYTLVQDVFGAAFGTITPVGTPYDVSVPPTAAPSMSPTAVPLISDATSVTIIGTATQGTSPVGLVTGPAASAIVALTSLNNAPPQYGGAIPFSGSNYMIQPPTLPRSIVRASPDVNGSILLARGPSDLLVFGGTIVSTGYQYNAQADDTTLGSGATLRGQGNLAFDPRDVSRVLVGGTSSGAGNVLTLITGLPTKIVKSSSAVLPGNINSIEIDPSGTYAYVATDLGVVVVNGVASGTLAVVRPGFEPGSAAGTNALPYTNCNGVPAALTFASSARITSDGRRLVVLGTQPGTTCASGYNASVVAIPFNPGGGSTPSPGPAPSPTPTPPAGTTPVPNPSSFVQNNVIAPPSAADYFLVH
ncbi:MAG: hypothetical protein GIX03_04080 [Candidatus Eremiobacteraeota bacterium]|nr:hypothetical protein [Candidatus Eremiobacteraeota bacterium]MBC5802186.1 hypothetical protein [Candidatus Eremiobacteraeota bacterium]MBC5821551.1 hypothetical protein [Candidatus Eremiobacteraeota bacterium]